VNNYNYTYNIPEIHVYEFERMRAFVETAYQDSLRSKTRVEPMEVVQATTRLLDIPSLVRGKTDQSGTYVGLAWPGTGRMWVKSGRDVLDMQRTAVHELAHLRVSGQAHGPKWRRVNAVAFAMWLDFQTDTPWADIQREIGRVVYGYRKYRRFTPEGLYNPRSEYLSKCEAEYLKIVQAARKLCGKE
jgi:hypothetical protein